MNVNPAAGKRPIINYFNVVNIDLINPKSQNGRIETVASFTR